MSLGACRVRCGLYCIIADERDIGKEHHNHDIDRSIDSCIPSVILCEG